MRRTTKVAIGLLVVIALAGCTGGFGSSGGGTDHVEYVPSDAEFVGHVDMAVLEDDDSRELMNALAQQETTTGDVDDAMSQFEDETGLDPSAVNDVVVFSTASGANIEDSLEQQQQGGVIVYSDWSEDEFISAVEENGEVEYEETERNGMTVYEPQTDEEMYTTPQYIGVLEDGTYVIGDETSVDSSIAVAAGEDDGLSGEMRDAYDSMDGGYVTFVGTVPGEAIPEQSSGEFDASAFQDVSVVGASYGTSSGTVTAEAVMYVDSEDSASDVADVTEGGLAMVRGTTTDEDLKSELQSIEVEQDGDIVEVTYEGNVETLVDLIESANNI